MIESTLKTSFSKLHPRNKLLVTYSLCLILSSITSIVFNEYLGLSHEINIVLICIILIHCWTLHRSINNKISHKGSFIYLISLISFLPLAWIFNGGLQGSIPVHFFVYLTAGGLILTDKYRTYFIVVLCIITAFTLTIEILFPSIIYPYESERSKVIDLRVSFIQVTLSILALIDTYSRINSAYQNELITQKNKLNKSYAELSIAKEKAEQATIAKSNFVTNISHEIRTPLHAIEGIADLLTHYNLNKEQNILLSSLNTSSKILSDLVRDLLDFSKIEVNKMTVNTEIFDIRHTIHQVHDLISLQIKDKDINLQTTIDENIPTYLELDRSKYKQVLVNLLSNASKFTKVGSIHCHLKFDTKKNILTTIVSDTGIGISPENINLVFSPFTQITTDQNLESKGIGMGLAISKKLIELMKGSIQVKSVISAGSTFEFWIPVSPKDTLQTQEIKSTTPNKVRHEQSYYILVAEDNKINQIVMSKMLERLNHRFDIVNNGQEAVDLATRKQYDIVLMDIQMPVKNGIEAANEIHHYYKEEKRKAPVIIACSANASYQDLKSPELSCMTAYLTKPVGLDELSKQLNNLNIS